LLLTTYPLISSYTHNGDDTLQSMCVTLIGYGDKAVRTYKYRHTVVGNK